MCVCVCEESVSFVDFYVLYSVLFGLFVKNESD